MIGQPRPGSDPILSMWILRQTTKQQGLYMLHDVVSRKYSNTIAGKRCLAVNVVTRGQKWTHILLYDNHVLRKQWTADIGATESDRTARL
ncbi:hypothetical protein M5689_021466 [Euphorbia peplus]|nr:hypothetical protein M5689_021466 [Euphorbia peplus]